MSTTTIPAHPFNPFRAALPHLRTSYDNDRGGIEQAGNASDFICYAIERARVPWSVYPQTIGLKDKAIAHVERMLGKSSVVRHWLANNCPEYQRQPVVTEEQCQLRADLVQAYRWRWLTHLADQYDRGEIKL